MSVPALIQQGIPPALAEITDAQVVAAWLAKFGPHTRDAYRRDIEHLARHLGLSSGSAAAEILLAGGHTTANRIALSWRTAMADSGLSSATIARRLAALRSVVRLARQLGRANFTIDIDSPKVETYRDTSGPGRKGWEKVRDESAKRIDAKGLRDRAILRLLHDRALRRGEVVSLDLEHVEWNESGMAVMAMRKGKTDRVRIELAEPTAVALETWIRIRGENPGPLFTSLAPGCGNARLTGRSVHRITRDLGARAGVTRGTNPHGFRHESLTDALEKTNGDVRRVQRFSGHANLNVLMLYDDARRNPSLDVSRLVAADD